MLRYIENSEIPGLGTPRRPIRNEIKEFLNSGYPAAEITGIEHYKTPVSARAAYSMSIKRMRSEHEVSCIQRGNRVFLVRVGSDAE